MVGFFHCSFYSTQFLKGILKVDNLKLNPHFLLYFSQTFENSIWTVYFSIFFVRYLSNKVVQTRILWSLKVFSFSVTQIYL